MKKTYNNPTTRVLHIKVSNICIVSGNEGKASIYSDVQDASGALSRGGRNREWDDEEDE